MNKKEFGKLITHFRELRGINQRQFADKVGCSIATMSKVENGHQEAKSELVFSILSAILPSFDKSVLELEAEMQCREMQRASALYCGAV